MPPQTPVRRSLWSSVVTRQLALGPCILHSDLEVVGEMDVFHIFPYWDQISLHLTFNIQLKKITSQDNIKDVLKTFISFIQIKTKVFLLANNEISVVNYPHKINILQSCTQYPIICPTPCSLLVWHVCCILPGEMKWLKWCVSYAREGDGQLNIVQLPYNRIFWRMRL